MRGILIVIDMYEEILIRIEREFLLSMWFVDNLFLLFLFLVVFWD